MGGNYTLDEASYNYYRHRQVNSQVNQEKTLKRDMRILPPTQSATDKSVINSNSPSTPITAPSSFSSPSPGVSTQQDEHHVKIKEENDDVEDDMKTCTYSSDNDNESDRDFSSFSGISGRSNVTTPSPSFPSPYVTPSPSPSFSLAVDPLSSATSVPLVKYQNYQEQTTIPSTVRRTRSQSLFF